MTLLFAAAMFVNALLLFLVQPMFAKLLLPRFGGSPAVWTTCMLFFQSALLAGYAYSHWVVKLRTSWQQAAVHLVVMALPMLTLPIAVATSVSAAGSPSPRCCGCRLSRSARPSSPWPPARRCCSDGSPRPTARAG